MRHVIAPPSGRARRSPRSGPGRVAEHPAARSVRRRDRQRADPRGGALVGPAAVPSARRIPRTHRRHLRRGGLPVAAPAGGAGHRRERAGGRGRPVVADPPGLAVAPGDRPVPGRGLGESALELSRRPARADGGGRNRSGTRWSAVVDRAASGRPVRRVRRSTPGHDHQLGRGPRCRRRRPAAARRPGLAGRALAATQGGAGSTRPGRAGTHRGGRTAYGARAQRPARADLGLRPDPSRA